MRIRSRPGRASTRGRCRGFADVLAVLAALLLVAGCGAAGSGIAPGAAGTLALDFVTVAVAPTTASVAAGGVPIDFLATVTNGSSSGVSWEVDGVAGGTAAAGTISASGHYLSPGTVPSPATVTITAVSLADPTRSAAAAVTITPPAPPPPPAGVAIAPTSASAQAGIGKVAFTAAVTGSSGAAVTWQVNGVTGGSASAGTISANGLYTAPFDLPAPPTVTVTAALASNPAVSAAATVTLTPPVAVTVLPSAASVRAGNFSQAFAATLSNAPSAGVTWMVNGIPGGNATVGMITAWGVYTAPATAPTPSVVSVSAASVADPTRLASVPVTIVPSGSVSVSVSPASASLQANLGSQAFTATVSNSPSTAVSWQVNGIAGGNATLGTISASGLYRAPATAPAPPAVTVSAALVSDPTRAGQSPVTITPAVSVAITPASASVTVASGTQAFAASVANGATGLVSWQVNGVTGGSAATGTVSAAGLYRAPAQVPSPAGVRVSAVSVDDPSKSASASVTVSANPQLPTISGTPQPGASVGQRYLFQPVATSPSGAPLTFQVANLPAWASFDAGSGALAGTPLAANIGSYANVTISVSDGQNTAALPAFTITVNAGVTGSATLSWSPPTTRTDGTALTDLAGYRIYYGTAPGSYPNVITLANPGLSTYVVTNLAAGTYYFVATAYDASGVESAYSNSGSKTISE